MRPASISRAQKASMRARPSFEKPCFAASPAGRGCCAIADAEIPRNKTALATLNMGSPPSRCELLMVSDRIYHPRALYHLLSDSLDAFRDDGGPSMGAALAFYTLLSMAPLLLLVIMVAGMAIGPDQARAVLLGELGGLLGETGAEGVRSVLAAASTRESSAIGALVGVFVLIFSATTVFAELKTDLDRIWGFKAPPSGGIVNFL